MTRNEIIQRFLHAGPLLVPRGAASWKACAQALMDTANAGHLPDLRGTLVKLSEIAGKGGDRSAMLDTMQELYRPEYPIRYIPSDSEAEIVLKLITQDRLAALIVSGVLLILWDKLGSIELDKIRSELGQHLWLGLPYACALAAYKSGALLEAAALLQATQEALAALSELSLPRWYGTRLQDLGGAVDRAIQGAIANMAEQLYEACKTTTGLRGGVAALLWTLGYVPESYAFFATRLPLPSEIRLYRTVVAQSLQYMSFDPLVQLLWIELTSQFGFDYSSSAIFYGAVAVRFRIHNLPSDLLLAHELYAKAAIGVFGVGCDWSLYQRYIAVLAKLELPEEIEQNHAAVIFRLDLLEMLLKDSDLSTRFGGRYFPNQEHLYSLLTGRDSQEWVWFWESKLQKAGAIHSRNLLTSRGVQLNRGFNIPVFYLGKRADSDATRNFYCLEVYRAMKLEYWLRTVSPRVPGEHAETDQTWFDREDELIAQLRSARFVCLLSALPRDYLQCSRPSSDPMSRFFRQLGSESLENGGTHEFLKAAGLSPASEEERFMTVVGELEALYDEMRETLPIYSARRKYPVASVESFSEALAMHKHNPSSTAFESGRQREDS